ncbi:MAG: hypothetical protein KDB07_13365 [Planctomycetes bacterium]|nr:hypothetical protein [Planctomycetota bacterium]
MKTIAIITLTALLGTGCACKLVPAQLSKNAEQIDRNADYFLQKAEAGEVASVDVASSHKKLTAANKKLALDANKE